MPFLKVANRQANVGKNAGLVNPAPEIEIGSILITRQKIERGNVN